MIRDSFCAIEVDRMLQAAKKAKASARDVIEIQARAAHHTEFVSSRLLRRVYTDGNRAQIAAKKAKASA